MTLNVPGNEKNAEEVRSDPRHDPELRGEDDGDTGLCLLCSAERDSHPISTYYTKWNVMNRNGL